MAIEIIRLTTCKFCQEGAGAIYLDAHAVNDLYDDDDDIPSIENHTEIIRYNSALSETKPCAHLVQIALTISCKSARSLNRLCSERATPVAWLNPLVQEFDPHNVVGDLRDGLVCGWEHEEFRPQAQHALNVVDTWWCGVDPTGKTDRIFDVQGRVAFALSIPDFMESLLQSEELRQQAWREGRDTKREWAEIVQQREREEDEVIEEEGRVMEEALRAAERRTPRRR